MAIMYLVFTYVAVPADALACLMVAYCPAGQYRHSVSLSACFEMDVHDSPVIIKIIEIIQLF